MHIYDLRTEYQVHPLGLTVCQPRFSWKIQSEQSNTRQKFYQIIVYQENKCVWDTGRIESEQSVLVAYGGERLKEESEYLVEVFVEDNYGNKSAGEMVFETGVFQGENFEAEMITHNFEKGETACPVFQKSFILQNRVKKARIYATAHGVYEMELNGQRIGEDRMTPGWTSYDHRLQYQIYDITGSLREDNLLRITVGNGWYKGILGFQLQSDIYGDETGVFAEIHLEYEDGTKEIVKTDESWTVSTGKITYSEIYMGETIDTTLTEQKRGHARRKDFDKQVLVAQENEPVRITEYLPAKELIRTPKGELVVDFGQNITGLVRVEIKGEKGQKIVIRHAETLDKEGNFFPETLRSAKSVDTYICNGEQQVFLPHFTFHGFRYICVEGMTEITKEQFTACVMHSDMEKTGCFFSSNAKVNQLQSNISWGQRDNFLDIPTDCPQRDERLGWTGDAQIFSWTAAFNRNTALFFAKWLRDMAAESSLEQGVPHVVPDILHSYSSSAWSDAAVIIPWVLYQTYGDERVLRENWKLMHEWVDYIENQCEDNLLWQTGFQYGDWLALDKEESADRTGATDKYMIANAYYLYVTDLVRQTAEILGRKEDAEAYKRLYEKTLEAFRREYYTATGRIVSETQTGAVLSLYFNLAHEKDRKRILRTLISNIENHKNHLSTGFVGTPYICHALSENGEHGLAATLFMREDYPSWLYAVNRGATTIWERWNSIKEDGSFEDSGMNSLNHYAYGSIGDWMYRKIAGLNQLEPGYKRFQIKPFFVQGIEEVGVEFESVYGKIRSWYRCKDGEITVKISVPPNTSAVINLPEKEEEIIVGSGEYEWNYKTDTSLKMVKYSMDSTLTEITSQPLAVELLEKAVPGIMDTPMLEFAMQMSLAEMLGAAPSLKPVFEVVIKELNKQ